MMTFVDMCGLAVDGHCLCFNSCNQLFCDWMVVYKEQNEEGMTFRKYLCNTYITIISLYLFRINQQTAWRLRHGPPSPPQKKNHEASQFFKALDLVISGGFPTCRRNTSGFHIMRPPRISSDSWLIFYHEFF